jgi:hypothetical protein
MNTSLAQGDVALLENETAQRLLDSTELARLAYTALDGTPRVLPMLFTWTGDEFVMASFPRASKLAALRARPEVAITVDRAGPPPEVLLLRGPIEVTQLDGLVPEYVAAHHRYYGPEMAAENIANVEKMGVKMVRLALRPTWVGVIDFQTRFPAAMPS